MPRRFLFVMLGVVCGSGAASGQETRDLMRARDAYTALDYGTAIASARQALTSGLTRDGQIEAYELLGYSYGALDSTRQAVEAFRELIFLDPDREPDPVRVSPRITSLYASALGQVLVVRKTDLDSASFVAGRGSAVLRFEVSRPARVTVRTVVDGDEVGVDSLDVVGNGLVRWAAVLADGSPVPPGRHQLIIEAAAGRDRHAARVLVEVRHGPVDTVPYLTNVPGYARQPEMAQPGRNWRPLGLATLYTAVASGAALALENSGLGSPPRREIGGVSLVTLVTGFIMSLKKPDPVPVPSNILFNQFLDEELARRNALIAEDNQQRRRQVMMTVTPVPGRLP